MQSFPQWSLSPDLSRALAAAYRQAAPPAAGPGAPGSAPAPAAEPPPGLPPAEARIQALATIWSEAKYNFAYWDRVPGEAWWDEQFRRFLPRVAAAATEAEYWDLLRQFAALLDDGHTAVWLPPHLRAARAEPPLLVQPVEGRLVVVEGDGLPPGTEILAVGGRTAAEVHAEAAARLWASPPHGAAAFAAVMLLAGPAGTPARFQVRLPGGAVEDVAVDRTRTLWSAVRDRPPVQVRAVGDGVVCAAVNSMATMETARQFHQAFADFAGIRGLILDLRRNTGGSSDVGLAILGRLLEQPAPSSPEILRVYIPTMRAWGLPQPWLQLAGDPVVPDPGRPRFSGPVAVLTGPLTFSAAEDFLVSFRASRRGPQVGEPSGGSTGQPLLLPLPGGGGISICTKRNPCPDGSEFVGRGIMPDLPCAPTVAGLAAGRDEVLDRALDYMAEALGR